MGHGAWGPGHGAWGMGPGAWGPGHGAWGPGHGTAYPHTHTPYPMPHAPCPMPTFTIIHCLTILYTFPACVSTYSSPAESRPNDVTFPGDATPQLCCCVTVPLAR